MIIVIFVFIASLLMFIWVKRANRHFNSLAEKIPGPPTLPLLGNSLNILNYSSGVLNYYIKASKEYGPVTRHWMGSSLHVYLTEPDDVEILLKDNQNLRKSNAYNFYEPWVGNALLRSTGDHWKHHRKWLAPKFHLNNFKQFAEVFNEKGKILISKLAKHVDGEPFDITPDIEMYILDTVMETVLNQNINAQEGKPPEFLTALHKVLDITNRRIYNPLLHPDVIFNCTPMARDYYKQLDYIHNYCKKVIESRKKQLYGVDVKDPQELDIVNGNKNRVSFLNLLLEDQRMGNGFSDSDVMDELNNFIFGGQDTSTGLIFTIYNLAKHPDVQEKVYDEILELFGPDHDDLTLKDLQRVRYLDMVIRESLRIYPSAYSFSRELDTDVKLTNYTIPAGTSLTCFSYLLMRNERYFPDPEKFDPERFSPENSEKRHPYAYTTFGGGARVCIGQKYAMYQMKSIVITLLRHYRLIHVRDIDQMEDNIVLTPVGGIKLRLEKRN